MILNVELAQFYGPLDQLSSSVGLIHRLTERMVRKDDDFVRLEVRSQFPGSDDES